VLHSLAMPKWNDLFENGEKKPDADETPSAAEIDKDAGCRLGKGSEGIDKEEDGPPAEKLIAAASSGSSKTFDPPPRAAKDDCESAQLQEKQQEDSKAESLATLPEVRILEPTEKPIRCETLRLDVRLEIYKEGDGKTTPKESLAAHLTGRLPGGMVFESTRGKGQGPMRMKLGKGEILPGMELGLRSLTLGARAVIYIPAKLAYREFGIPGIIPPHTDLTFELELLEVDGTKAAPQERPTPPSTEALPGKAFDIPWWLARVERPRPSEYYLSFCRHMARGLPGDLPGAKAIPKKNLQDINGWDLARDGAAVIRGMQSDWKAAKKWDLEGLRHEFGSEVSLIKWIGPLFRNAEVLSDVPVWEANFSEYIDYIRALEAFDPLCMEEHAEHCPRLYLNGWPIFLQKPHLRELVCLPTFVEDISKELHEELEMTRSALLQMFLGKNGRDPEHVTKKKIEDANWELTKLFISPKGSITRLHFDNGGSHAWLSQVRGRKLFVCYPPEEGKYLHPFKGDEGLMSSSFLDPLAEDVLKKWPDYKNATPHVAIVEEGETIFAPQGWWHYAVALDTSVTIMRNFHSHANENEFYKRHDEVLIKATNDVLRGSKLMKGKTEKELNEFTTKILSEIRTTIKKKQRQQSA